MHVPAVLWALSAAAAAITIGKAAPEQQASLEKLAAQCPHTSSYVAGESSTYRGQRLSPRKLTELPRGTAYMAVYRRIGGCEAPLTMVDYRSRH